MKIERVWAMPSRWTFTVKPIRALIDKYLTENWADPFAGENSPAEHTNDIEGRGAKSQMDALEFLKSFPSDSLDGVLFDPPYSPDQCLRKYTSKFKGMAGMAEYHRVCRDEIARVIKPEGVAISFGWNSSGIGKKRSFEIEHILLVCHGGYEHDTIITVDRKIKAPKDTSFSF